MSFPSSCGEDLGLPALKMRLLEKSCRETFVFPADYIRTREQIPSAPCRMCLVGDTGVKQLLFHSFTERHCSKNPSDLLDNKGHMLPG